MFESSRGGDGAYSIPVASAARTVTGNSTPFSTFGPLTGLVVVLDVTAVGGTSPTLDLDLEDSVDGGASFNKASDVGGVISATGKTVLRLNATTTPITDLLRFRWTLGGTTPSFTFSVRVYGIRA